ncbi:NAD(P)/FAD-dependent oxidoreductase [Nostoc sp. TCL26-01]|uniref:NAD(P)/FAD-dependent oxidoreductase n=1 Tax=Nostoc sp. TCL26-01 TaxID=2576904 RepID=UPI0015BF75BF|nr:NAD(P)/FAD-dependent oxidoreductase [Nostoc sp. TCL26-01]QLE56435.1 NAD(P)/FAD-dependent oxidoreductase [Nostoc sp. TCL26-01]
MNHYDVVIVGGGPGGSTTGTLLKKYNPQLRVLILEKEKFPRDHVGESQLPQISDILNEMGCWDKVEAANFPIKVGGNYRWGKDPEPWEFHFLRLEEFKEEARPAKYEGQRRQTAFQVDRSIYDDILLRHAEELGCEVREQTAVVKVDTVGDRITALHLSSGEQITATYYADASGHVGILRKALGVQTECPTQLQNIAIWDYWNNADWAVEIGVGGTRIQIMSLGYGWIWFIPLGPTRTSVGFVCPASYYKEAKKSAAEIYQDALKQEPLISKLLANATSRDKIEITKDWSFLAERTVGENWFLVGEAAGFADPILSAGLTLTHVGAKELAYTLLDLHKGEHDVNWLKNQYDQNQRRRVQQHIRFADYWYAANGQFTDLYAHCQTIAKEAGLNLSPPEAFRWLAQGGFTNDIVGQAVIGGFDLGAMKQMVQRFAKEELPWEISGYNVFQLDLADTTEDFVAVYTHGKIDQVKCYLKQNGDRLPITGLYGLLIDVLSRTSDIEQIYQYLIALFKTRVPPEHLRIAIQHTMFCLEVMTLEGWVKPSLNPDKPPLTISMPVEGQLHYSGRS